jgi:hypothetical protein
MVWETGSLGKYGLSSQIAFYRRGNTADSSCTLRFNPIKRQFMAAEPGFEPGLRDPKSPVLPLHNSALHPEIRYFCGTPSIFFVWCRRSDSNRHESCPSTVFETAASTIPPLRPLRPKFYRATIASGSGILPLLFEPCNRGYGFDGQVSGLKKMVSV